MVASKPLVKPQDAIEALRRLGVPDAELEHLTMVVQERERARQWVTVRKAAQDRNLPYHRLRRWVDAGYIVVSEERLPGPGRGHQRLIDLNDLDRFLERERRPGRPCAA